MNQCIQTETTQVSNFICNIGGRGEIYNLELHLGITGAHRIIIPFNSNTLVHIGVNFTPYPSGTFYSYFSSS